MIVTFPYLGPFLHVCIFKTLVIVFQSRQKIITVKHSIYQHFIFHRSWFNLSPIRRCDSVSSEVETIYEYPNVNYIVCVISSEHVSIILSMLKPRTTRIPRQQYKCHVKAKNTSCSKTTILPPAKEVCGGYVFTGVCLSTGVACVVEGGVWCGTGCAWWEACMPRGMHGGVCVWWGGGGCVEGEMATTPADGTHPTGMHSCLKYFSTWYRRLNLDWKQPVAFRVYLSQWL